MLKTIATALAAMFILAGCNTLNGAAQDLRNASAEIDKALRK